MSWKDDTVAILADGGGSTVTVQSATINYNSGASHYSGTSDVWSGTVMIFTRRGRQEMSIHSPQGILAEATHNIFFPWTSTVSVGHRVVETGETDYYEVLRIAPYEDHKEILAKLVENR